MKSKATATPVDPASSVTAPALLVSFYYLSPFQRNRQHYHFRDWVMDSGAYSAHNSGVEINLPDFISTCQKLLAEDPQLTEVYALDVIGDWRASHRNLRKMWRAGVEAIPCFHYGEPWDVLIGLSRDYPKIAIGGCVGIGKKQKHEFAEQCFARVWPKRIHGFGFGSPDSVKRLPFHSVDATTWETGPACFGRWNQFGRMSVRGAAQNLLAEVEFYLQIERDVRRRWAREMQELGADGPTCRLAHNTGSAKGKYKVLCVRREHDQSSVV